MPANVYDAPGRAVADVPVARATASPGGVRSVSPAAGSARWFPDFYPSVSRPVESVCRGHGRAISRIVPAPAVSGGRAGPVCALYPANPHRLRNCPADGMLCRGRGAGPADDPGNRLSPLPVVLSTPCVVAGIPRQRCETPFFARPVRMCCAGSGCQRRVCRYFCVYR